MLISRLPSILGANHLNISKVAKDTGISRTTLTALCYGDGKGVQFDTLNALCMYLNVTVDQIIEFLPFNLSVLEVAYGGMILKEKNKEQILCKAYLRYEDKWTKSVFSVDISITLFKFHDERYVDDIKERLGFAGQEKVADMIYSKIFDEILTKDQDYDFSPLDNHFSVNFEFV